MKNNVTIKLAAGLLALALIPQVHAFSTKITRVSGYYSGPGGEFTVGGGAPEVQSILTGYSSKAKATSSFTGLGFQTFCIEKDEGLSIPDNYTSYITGAAMEGGIGGPSPDPISAGTSLLYSLFATGSLPGYVYTPGPGRAASAAMLQDTIWWLEDEQANPNNTFSTWVLGQFGNSIAAAKADAGGGPVYALNNYQGREYKQDVLVYRHVPEGGVTLALFGAGVLGLLGLRRRIA